MILLRHAEKPEPRADRSPRELRHLSTVGVARALLLSRHLRGRAGLLAGAARIDLVAQRPVDNRHSCRAAETIIPMLNDLVQESRPPEIRLFVERTKTELPGVAADVLSDRHAGLRRAQGAPEARACARGRRACTGLHVWIMLGTGSPTSHRTARGRMPASAAVTCHIK